MKSNQISSYEVHKLKQADKIYDLWLSNLFFETQTQKQYLIDYEIHQTLDHWHALHIHFHTRLHLLIQLWITKSMSFTHSAWIDIDLFLGCVNNAQMSYWMCINTVDWTVVACISFRFRTILSQQFWSLKNVLPSKFQVGAKAIWSSFSLAFCWVYWFINFISKSIDHLKLDTI